MAEPRKDVKVYLDPEVHAALKAIAASKDVGLAEFIESIAAASDEHHSAFFCTPAAHGGQIRGAAV